METQRHPSPDGDLLGLAVGAQDHSGVVNEVAEHPNGFLELDEQLRPGAPAEQVLHEYPQLVQILRESFSMSSLPNRAEIDLRCRSDHGKTIGFTLSLVRDFPRQALHARTLKLLHPDGGEECEFNSPLPEDLAGLIAGLASSDSQ